MNDMLGRLLGLLFGKKVSLPLPLASLSVVEMAALLTWAWMAWGHFSVTAV